MPLQTVAPEVAGLLDRPIGCQPAPGPPSRKRPETPPQTLSFGHSAPFWGAESDGDGEKQPRQRKSAETHTHTHTHTLFEPNF
eukprot:6004533-Alexandrium_andersonii.AAC.1